ncbi:MULTISPECIES: DUF952 domain-containing protein [unclassified Sphingomonas]|jgi:uncharacterized protein (DUF952 family)|uniref:DUF952 domain-containing protein n=1 Tax=unclassified Sphingomonas TaxID=196159 RepID=UPI000833A437|nr:MULTISPECIES: DUF952 domain-containing protein [unclassified Sphingomonas]
MTHPATAYKILTADQMAALREDRFDGAQVDLADGYIHLSTADQVTETVDRHFAGQSDLWIAAVDLAPLGDAIRWEASRGGALFPHLYGRLTMASITVHAPLSRDGDGTVQLPG